MCAFVLTKLLLSSQWVTGWPPQDSAYVRAAITQHGGSGPGVRACFNTRHRWVTLWARCCGLPSAASSGCPDSKLMRLTIATTHISPHSVPCPVATMKLYVSTDASNLYFSYVSYQRFRNSSDYLCVYELSFSSGG